MYKPDQYSYKPNKIKGYNPNDIAENQKGTTDKVREFSKIVIDDIQYILKTAKTTRYCISEFEKIGFPEKSYQYRIRTQKQLNQIAIILYALSIGDIDELTISTYTFNIDAIEVIKKSVLSGRIKRCNLIIASSYKFRDQKHFNLIIDELKGVVNLAFVWIHCKITLIKMNDDYICIEGSMNYSMNNHVEQILIENDKNQYEFDYKFLTDTIIHNDHKSTEVITWEDQKSQTK